MKRRSSASPLLLIIAALCISLLLKQARRKPAAVQPSPGSASIGPQTSASSSAASFPRTVIDARGKTLTLKAAPTRIVSLIPNVTEILYALNLGDRLVADTSACDYPPQARAKPHIDVFKGDREQIEIHNPDLVIAVGGLDPDALIAALEKDGVPVLVLKESNLEQTYQSIAMIGKATGQDWKAELVGRDMQAHIQNIQKIVGGATDKPSVLVMFGDNPIYTVGPTGASSAYINDIINIAGGANIVTEPPINNQISPEKVVERQPDVIICDKALAPRVKLLPGWDVVPAVAQDRFFQTSDKTTLLRPGPRLPLAAEELARYLHPGLFKTAAR